MFPGVVQSSEGCQLPSECVQDPEGVSGVSQEAALVQGS